MRIFLWFVGAHVSRKAGVQFKTAQLAYEDACGNMRRDIQEIAVINLTVSMVCFPCYYSSGAFQTTITPVDGICVTQMTLRHRMVRDFSHCVSVFRCS